MAEGERSTCEVRTTHRCIYVEEVTHTAPQKVRPRKPDEDPDRLVKPRSIRFISKNDRIRTSVAFFAFPNALAMRGVVITHETSRWY